MTLNCLAGLPEVQGWWWSLLNFSACFPDCIIAPLLQLAATDNMPLRILNSQQCQHILWHLPEQIKDLNVMSGPKIMKWNKESSLFIYFLFIGHHLTSLGI
jgi:hypothetical protein